MCLRCNKPGEEPRPYHGRSGRSQPWLAERNRSPEHRALVTKHGLSYHPLYRRWQGMLQRCENPGHQAFKNYGGRGITVLAEWHDVAVFIAWIEANLGPRPDGCTLDRVDNDGNYEPGNLRWATHSAQAANQRKDGRPLGSAKPLAALTEEIVRQCRVRWADGETQQALAAEHGVSKPTMHKAVTGKTWQHVTA